MSTHLKTRRKLRRFSLRPRPFFMCWSGISGRKVLYCGLCDILKNDIKHCR